MTPSSAFVAGLAIGACAVVGAAVLVLVAGLMLGGLIDRAKNNFR